MIYKYFSYGYPIFLMQEIKLFVKETLYILYDTFE